MKFDPQQMPGQMTVDDCIEVAEDDLDGMNDKINQPAEDPIKAYMAEKLKNKE